MCWRQLKNGKWVQVIFPKEVVLEIYHKVYRYEIATKRIKKIDIEHPVRNLTADREIGFAHPEYWKSRISYTYSHKIDLVVFFRKEQGRKQRIDIWETEDRPKTETIGQLLCYREWIEREHPDAEIRMNYVVPQKFSEIDYIAWKFNILTWLVVIGSNDEVLDVKKYTQTSW